MDYLLKASINRLIKTSLYLFLFTNIAIFGTLFTHNILTTSKFTFNTYPFSNEHHDNNEQIKIFNCNESNNFCSNLIQQSYFPNLKNQSPLDQCPIYYHKVRYHIDNLIFKKFPNFVFLYMIKIGC